MCAQVGHEPAPNTLPNTEGTTNDAYPMRTKYKLPVTRRSVIASYQLQLLSTKPGMPTTGSHILRTRMAAYPGTMLFPVRQTRSRTDDILYSPPAAAYALSPLSLHMAHACCGLLAKQRKRVATILQTLQDNKLKS